jgi:hypothetical protein
MANFVIVEGLCLLGALLWCYWHYSRPFRPDLQAYPDQYHWFDEFWNDLFKFPEWRTLAGWFVWPYFY